VTKVAPPEGQINTLELALSEIKKFPFLHLFPVMADNKAQPLLRDYLKRASNDPATIRRWHAYWKTKFGGIDCWWGVAPALSGLVFADIDTKPGKCGQQTFDLFDMLYGWPQTLVSESPSSGRHRWYRGAHLFAIGLASSNHPDIDFAQFIVLPGCQKTDGTAYRWLEDRPIADAPEWFYSEAKRTAQRPDAAETTEPVIDLDKEENIAWAEDFLRNDAEPSIGGKGGEFTMLKVAMILRERGISQPLAVELINDIYNIPGRCDPQWEGEELERKIANGYIYASINAPGGATAEADFAGDDAEAEFASIKVEEPEEVEKEVAERARRKSEEQAEPKPQSTRPQVRVLPSLLHEAMDETQAILIKQSRKSLNKNGGSTIADQVFQQGGRLVRLNRNLHLKQKKGHTVAAETKVVDGVIVDSQYQERNALTVLEVRAPWLTTRLGRTIQYMGPSAGKPVPGKKPPLKPKDVPLSLVNQLIGDETQWKFPALFSTIEAPTLRADGSILDEPGYDPASGMFFDPGDIVFPKIKPNPTVAEGEAAIKFVDDEMLGSFPFVDQDGYKGVSRAVALAMQCTGPVRRGLKTAPAFAADSNEPESGKSMLLKAAGALMTGREIAGRPFSNNEEERRKALGTAFVENRPVLFFDNVDCVIEGASLEMALTTPLFEDRKLGSHEGISAPTNSLTLFSANHVSVGGDGMSTRVLVSRIVPAKTLAQRLADGDFKHPNLIDWIIENRPKLIAAVLTALRAFIIHGHKDAKPTISRFPEWGNLIGNALIWYGYADPTRGGDAIRAADPVKEAMRGVVRAWGRQFGDAAVTAAQLVSSPEVREAIAGATKKREQDITAHNAPAYIKKLIGVNLDLPSTVEAVPGPRSRAQRWRLVQTERERMLPDPAA
jgi:hypothetical protein